MAMKMSRDELSALMKSGRKFRLVDVLPREHYKKEHIKGAISIPLVELEKKAPGILPEKSEMIIVYCASFECQASTSAAKQLERLGYTNVLDYKGGLADYKEANLPLEGE